ncbi:MAG: UDP-N-acetylmuramoyl-tripeptide--D-alanyl-D-alanine ligase [Oscillospiraceae bacterium]|nr:UDP-N-acetylmuramoyl-tripeptide--D-alanyl-D-alanine ligase [Oscillospiraceae bacterium]
MEAVKLSLLAAAMGAEAAVEADITHICTDTRKLTQGCLFVALKGENFDGHRFVKAALEQGAVAAVVHQPVEDVDPDKLLEVMDTQDALLDMASIYRDRFPELNLIAVTGSVGKTTTKDFIACVVSAGFNTHKTEGNQNNEIGVPATVYGLTADHGAAVVEMGMQGLGEILDLTLALHPTIGVITNIGVSHIERLGSRENILQAKLELCEGLEDGAPLFLCGDNDLLATVQQPRLDVIFYGVDNPACAIRGGEIKEEGDSTSFVIMAEGQQWSAVIPCVGRHNVLNALAAFGVGRKLGIPAESCIRALQNYQPSGMRQHVVRCGGVTIVEDCYNASPDSMQAALNTLKTYPCSGRRIALLADMLELGEIAEQSHLQVGRLAAESADVLYCYGQLGQMYAKGAKQNGSPEVYWFEDKADLAETLCGSIKEGDVVWAKASRGMKLEEALQPLQKKLESK